MWEQNDEQQQIREYYQSIEGQVNERFHNLTTNTLEQIKNRLRHKQDQQSQEENLLLIENQREKVIAEMKKHLEQCKHPHCAEIDQIIIRYELQKGCKKQDPMSLIVRPNVQGLSKIQTDCFFGAKINAKMWETHRLMAGID